MAPPELGPHSTKLQSIDTGGIQIGVFRISPIIGVVDLNVERLQKGGVDLVDQSAIHLDN